jgi:hypothetical protein
VIRVGIIQNSFRYGTAVWMIEPSGDVRLLKGTSMTNQMSPVLTWAGFRCSERSGPRQQRRQPRPGPDWSGVHLTANVCVVNVYVDCVGGTITPIDQLTASGFTVVGEEETFPSRRTRSAPHSPLC